MALEKISPDSEKVQKLALRIKELIETTWLRDSQLNNASNEEIAKIRVELESMGLTVRYSVQIVFEPDIAITADVEVFIPKNTTIH